MSTKLNCLWKLSRKFTYHNGKRLQSSIPANKLKKLEEDYAKFSKSKSNSLLKKHLTKDIFDCLKTRQTSFKSTLLDCVQSGFANHDSNIGVYAPDAEAYTVFAELFDRIIETYHFGFKKSSIHPKIDFGNVDCFKNLDPKNKFVVSIRIRCGRSLHGYPFNPCLQKHQYQEIEEMVTKALYQLKNELKGEYYPLCGMDDGFKKCLIDNHFLFKEGDRFLQAANASRFWPLGRGIYFNEDVSFLVWVNEEDHIRIISMEKGGDIHAVYARLVAGAEALNKLLQFTRHKRLGYLTFCPTNLGTTIRASVHIKLPKLSKDKAKFEEVAAKFNLQIRGTSGEHSESIGGVYDISNKQRIGLTEYQAVKTMQDGILEMIKIEQSL